MNAVLRSPKVKKELDNFVVVKLNFDEKEVDQLKISSFPMIIFFDSQGKEISRHEGYRDEKEMIKLLQKIRKK